MRRNHMPQSGIQIENTLSMAVQNRTSAIGLPYLIVIALVGIYSSYFTFLSMYEMNLYEKPLFMLTAVLFGVFAFFASTPKKFRGIKISFLAVLILAFVMLYEKIVHGFVHAVNVIYKVIYMTDQNYYLLDDLLPEKLCLTVLLFFGAAAISFSVCYGVIRYQNFFMCFLTTFAVAEVGFFFGIAADHLWASMLFAFWCTSAAIRFAGYGTGTEKNATSFLRRKNTFFPAGSMRFMVTGRVGMMLLAGVTALCLLIDQVLTAAGYTRSEQMKTIRAQVQDFSIAFQMSEDNPLQPFFQSLWGNANKKQQEVVDLSKEDEPEFENEIVSSVRFNKIPDGRVYLKYYTGHIYGDNTWRLWDDVIYDSVLMEQFEKAQLHPQEFLYYGMESFPGGMVSMILENPNDIMKRCVPYGFKPKDEITCLYDDRFGEIPDGFAFFGGQDYETLLSAPENTMWIDALSMQRMITDREGWFPEVLGVYDTYPLFGMQTEREPSDEALRVSLLCETAYSDFANEYFLYLPESPAMEQIRSAYAPMLSGYDAQHATPSDTIRFLQELRDELCSSVSYTLSPGKTPVGEDFAEYFLLRNQKGYCVHYATAGTLLARMAGIPARYCEGYIIDCESNPTLTSVVKGGTAWYNVNVLDSNAHSWTEIYIEGLGWIPFEFTFSYFTPPEEQVTEPATTEPFTESTAPMTETTLPGNGTTYVPIPIQTTGIASETETVTETTNTESESPSPNRSAMLISLLIPLAVLIMLGLMLGIPWLLWRMAWRRRMDSFEQDDSRESMKAIYAYLIRLLAHCGVRDADGSIETFSQIAQEKCGHYLTDEYSLKKAIDIAAKMRYSPHAPTKQELHYLRRCTMQLSRGIEKAAGRMQRLKLRYWMHLV